MSDILLLSVGHDRGDLELLLPVATCDFQGGWFHHQAGDLLGLVGSERKREDDADGDGERQGSMKKVGHGGVPPGSTVDPEIRLKSRCQQLRIT